MRGAVLALSICAAALLSSVIAMSALVYNLYFVLKKTRKQLDDANITELSPWKVYHIYLMVHDPQTWTKNRNITYGHAEIQDSENHCTYNLYSCPYFKIKGFNKATNEFCDIGNLETDVVAVKGASKIILTGVIVDERCLRGGASRPLVKMRLPTIPIPVDPLDGSEGIKDPWVAFSR
ncbi:uncharacterized protein FMAN_09604 [Fusarium mangiferae]|uniref:Uncharacterized protein n=1 Tax=Fusarium mangiferae TaxID=192010 RepID=A0A1L7T491_FUSMA|nr:uncharacterized protein FMAN_09604 [Fusarium mangiferae]CVK91532.1 uncharacterized protein FMAN_09604 [Fusarium mangiferae]